MPSASKHISGRCVVQCARDRDSREKQNIGSIEKMMRLHLGMTVGFRRRRSCLTLHQGRWGRQRRTFVGLLRACCNNRDQSASQTERDYSDTLQNEIHVLYCIGAAWCWSSVVPLQSDFGAIECRPRADSPQALIMIVLFLLFPIDSGGN